MSTHLATMRAALGLKGEPRVLFRPRSVTQTPYITKYLVTSVEAVADSTKDMCYFEALPGWYLYLSKDHTGAYRDELTRNGIMKDGTIAPTYTLNSMYEYGVFWIDTPFPVAVGYDEDDDYDELLDDDESYDDAEDED